MGENNLRKQRFKLGLLDCQILDVIPNERVSAHKIQRQGSSNVIVLPFQWEMMFPDKAEVCKVLVKVKIPTLGKLATIEYHGMLVFETSDFPVEKIVRK